MLKQLSSSPLHFLCPSDPHVRAWETAAKSQSLAPGVLECYRPHSYPPVLCWDGSPSARPASPERWTCHLLRQHYLLVHPAAGHLRREQVPGALCHDDRENGKRSWRTSSVWQRVLGSVSLANGIAAGLPTCFLN